MFENIVLIVITDRYAEILRLVAIVFISETDKAVKFVFQQLLLGHYLVI